MRLVFGVLTVLWVITGLLLTLQNGMVRYHDGRVRAALDELAEQGYFMAPGPILAGDPSLPHESKRVEQRLEFARHYEREAREALARGDLHHVSGALVLLYLLVNESISEPLLLDHTAGLAIENLRLRLIEDVLDAGHPMDPQPLPDLFHEGLVDGEIRFALKTVRKGKPWVCQPERGPATLFHRPLWEVAMWQALAESLEFYTDIRPDWRSLPPAGLESALRARSGTHAEIFAAHLADLRATQEKQQHIATALGE